MNCAIAVPNISHNTFSSPPNSTSSSCCCSNLFCHPMSPSMMVMLQNLEAGPVSSSSHHHGRDHHEVPPLLKRRRPARINVPVASDNKLMDMVNVVGSTRDDGGEKEVEVEGDGYGVYSKKGRSRARLEDRYSAIVNNVSSDTSKQAFFGVFDGHGGVKAAEFAASRLGKNILDNVGRETGITKSDKLIEEEIRDSYLATDGEFLRKNAAGGSCCVTAMIQDGKLMVSHVGDCRAVMSRGGLAEALTTDHTPSREDEKMRIEAKGGYVDCCNGVWRIQGSLAVSRALGDQHLKEWVTAEPDTKIVDIQHDCEFLILASDGLWDKVTNQEAVDTIIPFCTGDQTNKSELAHACRKLAELSISRGSSDDTSVVVVQLGRFA